MSLEEKPVKAPIMVRLMFLKLILALTNFIFNGCNYLQTKGCAMGTKCAPCYANIFMGKFEETFIYLTVKDLHGCYLRYIDHIFMIWTGSKERFENFNQEISSCHPTIKFDYEIHHKEVTFFDATVFTDSARELKTKTVQKTNRLPELPSHQI